MKTRNLIAKIEKTGCKLEMVADGRMIRVIRNGRTSGYIFNNDNVVRFCGKSYVECTGCELFAVIEACSL